MTVTERTFLPVLRSFDPLTEITAFESCVSALMVHTVTSEPTFTVYDVTDGENEGERLPADTDIYDRFALPETEGEELLTETVVETLFALIS